MKNTHDVPLPDGTEDEPYLDLLRQWLPRLIEQHRPQLMLFQAGVDALHGDRCVRLRALSIYQMYNLSCVEILAAALAA